MRIIGGSAKGTALLSPVGKGMTRPTLGRVRESIFNVLANVGMKDTRVLDIFAGTGAMGPVSYTHLTLPTNSLV